MDDPFDEISNLNTSSYNEGYTEGVLSGKRGAIVQGFKMGIKTSFSIAQEIGNCYGACQLYKRQNATDQSSQSEKLVKLASQICELVEKFDLNDCHSETFSNNLNLIKDKFKQFCSLANIKNVCSKQESSVSKLNF